jgi:hypothetical protein
MTAPKVLAIVPFSADYNEGRLLVSGGPLDRDGSLVPWVTLASALTAGGWKVDTSDRLDPTEVSAWLHLDSTEPPPQTSNPARTVVMMFEPEVVSPYWYRHSEGRPPFATIYTHSLDLVRRGPPYEYLRWPQVLGTPPHVAREEFLVMINNRKYPVVRRNELYGERERVARWMARRGLIGIYGAGWDRSTWRHPLSALRTRDLRKGARGTVTSKFDVLGRARFVLCFENQRSEGYHTEKLFDAIAAGAVPIYWGDPRITEAVPATAFIDYDVIRSPAALAQVLEKTDHRTQDAIRAAGRSYLSSPQFLPYTIAAFVERLAAKFEAFV